MNVIATTAVEDMDFFCIVSCFGGEECTISLKKSCCSKVGQLESHYQVKINCKINCQLN